MKYKNKDGIEFVMPKSEVSRIGSGMDLVQEIAREAVRLCGEYNWHDETSMRFALSNVKEFLIENFDLEEK